MSANNVAEQTWWKEAIVYQIYPASFYDSDADGLGDIPGILSKLDYLSYLGVTAVWLSPIFSSPQKDMGYDISDYRSIHSPYGTISDVEKLIDGLHERRIKILLDLVVNHTSDQHEWFKESKSERESKKRDWYFWRDAKIGDNGERKPPNNWASIFGGSAWHWDEGSQQYYLALFLPEQPDLNWENEEMRKSTYEDMHFWFKKGVDGFRVDSMNLMSKHPDLPDAEVVDDKSEWQNAAKWYASGPRMHEYIQEMTREVFSKYDSMTVGELGGANTFEEVGKYVARERKELNCVFTGDMVDLDFGKTKYERNDFALSKLRDVTEKWQKGMPLIDGWNTIYLDNHDSGRSLSRYASDKPEFRERAAKMLATYMCTLSGNLFLLQGQEIGMANIPDSWDVEDFIDVEGRKWYDRILKERGQGASMDDVMRELRLKARDNGRLPMQWNGSLNAGFTKAQKPWMKVNDDYPKWNVENQLGKENSVLEYWKQMLKLRMEHRDVFVYGIFELLPESWGDSDMLAYSMTSKDGMKTALVVLSFTENATHGLAHNFRMESLGGKLTGDLPCFRRLIGDSPAVLDGSGNVSLEGYGSMIYCNWN